MSRSTSLSIVCRSCGLPYRTTVRGGKTRCPINRGGCGAQRYVRRGERWAGPDSPAAHHPALDRTPVKLECNWCGVAWESWAASGCSVRCPSCQHTRRVPVRPAAPVRRSSAPARARQSAAPALRPSVPAPKVTKADLMGLLVQIYAARQSQRMPLEAARSPWVATPSQPWATTSPPSRRATAGLGRPRQAVAPPADLASARGTSEVTTNIATAARSIPRGPRQARG